MNRKSTSATYLAIFYSFEGKCMNEKNCKIRKLELHYAWGNSFFILFNGDFTTIITFMQCESGEMGTEKRTSLN